MIYTLTIEPRYSTSANRDTYGPAVRVVIRERRDNLNLDQVTALAESRAGDLFSNQRGITGIRCTLLEIADDANN